jgi:hypothetical protein
MTGHVTAHADMRCAWGSGASCPCEGAKLALQHCFQYTTCRGCPADTSRDCSNHHRRVLAAPPGTSPLLPHKQTQCQTSTRLVEGQRAPNTQMRPFARSRWAAGAQRVCRPQVGSTRKARGPHQPVLFSGRISKDVTPWRYLVRSRGLRVACLEIGLETGTTPPSICRHSTMACTPRASEAAVAGRYTHAQAGAPMSQSGRRACPALQVRA